MFMLMFKFHFIEKQTVEMACSILAFSYRPKWEKNLSIQLIPVVVHFVIVFIIVFSIVRSESGNIYYNIESSMEKSRSM